MSDSTAGQGRDDLQRRIRDLEATEERFRSLLDHAPDLIVRMTPQLTFADVNRRFCELLQVDRAAVVGRGIDQLGLSPEAQSFWSEVCGAAVRTGRSRVVQRPFGDRILETVVVPEFDAAGNVESLVAVSRDVTERHQAELARKTTEARLRELNEQLERRAEERARELRESEALFGALSEQMPDGMLLIEISPENDQDTGRIVLANPALLQMLGYQEHEFVGHSIFEFEDPRTRSGALHRLARYAAGETLVFEGMLRDKQGGMIPLEASARRITFGQREMVLAVIRDLTRRYAMERQLRLVQSAVEHVHEAVVITDARVDRPGPTIVYVNPAFERMTGYAPDEVLGRTPRLLQGPQTSRSVLDQLRNSLERGEPFRGEAVNYHKSGRRFEVQWDIAPIRQDGGQIINWVAILRDVTQEKLAERRAAQHQAEIEHVSRLSTMGEMASGLAHELNQPLAAILNYARGSIRRMDRGDVAPEAIRDSLEQIAGQAERSGQIIQRLRRFIRKREPRRLPTDINQVVEETLGLIRGEAKRRQVDLVFVAGEGLPVVLTDTIQMEQVLLNLITNAMDAMAALPPAERVIQMETAVDGDREVRVSVRDRGAGANDQDLDHLFEPFFTTKATGMGMGLTISQTIVEAHQGELRVERNPEQGLTFHIYLPASD